MATDREAAGICIRIPGAKVFVRVSGEGQPVLLLHGGGPGTSGGGWLDMMAAGAPGLQFYAPDLPGFGYSTRFDDGHDYGTPAFVNATLALMDALCLDHAVLAGHSMGSAVAAALAVRHPERIRHLVLIGPGGGFYGITDYESAGMAQIAKTTRDPSEAEVRALVELMSYQRAGHETQIRHRLHLLARPEIVATQRALVQSRASPSADLTRERNGAGQKMRSFAPPVTMIWGAEERFNPFELGERIRAALPPHTDYCVIPGAGHNVQYDQPEAVAQVFRNLG